MKRYRLFILLVVVLSSFLGSCDEQDVIRYENDPRIYFYKGIVYDNVARTSYTQSDSVKRSFFVLPDTQMWVPFGLISELWDSQQTTSVR